MSAFHPDEDPMEMDDFMHHQFFFEGNANVNVNYDDIFPDMAVKNEDIDQDAFGDIQWSDEDAYLSDASGTVPAIDRAPSSITAELSQGRLPPTLFRWLSPQEIKILLDAVNSESLSLSRTVRQRPQSGSIFLFDRSAVKFRKDGFDWEKRADGRTVREDHAKLKVAKLNVIYSCYAHLEGHPSFHRRCYWLLDSPRIILVHYLDTGTPAPTIHVPIPPAPKLLSKSCKADVGVSKEAKAKVSKTGSAPARKGSKNSATTAGGAGHRSAAKSASTSARTGKHAVVDGKGMPRLQSLVVSKKKTASFPPVPPPTNASRAESGGGAPTATAPLAIPAPTHHATLASTPMATSSLPLDFHSDFAQNPFLQPDAMSPLPIDGTEALQHVLNLHPPVASMLFDGGGSAVPPALPLDDDDGLVPARRVRSGTPGSAPTAAAAVRTASAHDPSAPATGAVLHELSPAWAGLAGGQRMLVVGEWTAAAAHSCVFGSGTTAVAVPLTAAAVPGVLACQAPARSAPGTVPVCVVWRDPTTGRTLRSSSLTFSFVCVEFPDAGAGNAASAKSGKGKSAARSAGSGAAVGGGGGGGGFQQRVRSMSLKDITWKDFLVAKDLARLSLDDGDGASDGSGEHEREGIGIVDKQAEYAAARTIQRAFHRYMAEVVRKKKQAVAVIESSYVRYKEQHRREEEEAAAIAIQAQFRAMRQRNAFIASRRAALLLQRSYRRKKQPQPPTAPDAGSLDDARGPSAHSSNAGHAHTTDVHSRHSSASVDEDAVMTS